MSRYDPEEYSGIDWNAVGREEDRKEREAEVERCAAIAQEAEEERARELAFHDTPFCEEACYETMIHAPACVAVNFPVAAAVVGWRRSQQVAIDLSDIPSEKEAA